MNPKEVPVSSDEGEDESENASEEDEVTDDDDEDIDVWKRDQHAVVDIRQLDPKTQVELPELNEASLFPPTRAVALDLWPGVTVWHLQRLLTNDECESLLRTLVPVWESAGSTQDALYRDAARVVIDPASGAAFAQSLSKRLRAADAFAQRLNLGTEAQVQPLGFLLSGADEPKWDPPELELNPCLRVSSYADNSNGFVPHRDAPYTASHALASDRSLVLTLQAAIGGELTVWAPSNRCDGCTIAEELADGKLPCITLPSLPAGDAYVFDQRLIHAVRPNEHRRIVLRTDLLRSRSITPAQSEAYLAAKPCEALRVARALFRAAEIGELEHAPSTRIQELYERSLSLRQSLQRTVLVSICPAALEMYTAVQRPAVILPPMAAYGLQVTGRSPEQMEFAHCLENLTDLHAVGMAVAAAALFTLRTQATALCSQAFDALKWEQLRSKHSAEAAAAKVLRNALQNGDFEVTKTVTDPAPMVRIEVCVEVERGELYRCGICDGDKSYERYTAQMESAEFDEDELENVPLTVVRIDKAWSDHVAGVVNCTTLSSSFNHASCQCFYECADTMEEIPVVYARFSMDFSMSSRYIHITPQLHIVM